MDVLPLPNGSHARPRRGEKCVSGVETMPRPTPGSPTTNRPVGTVEGNTFDCTPSLNVASLSCGSVGACCTSQRSPTLSVRRGEIFQSSCTNSAPVKKLSSASTGASWFIVMGKPRKKSESALLDFAFVPVKENTP